MKNFFNKDNFIFGIAIGAIVPLIFFGIIYGIDYLLRQILDKDLLISISTMQLVAIVGNVLLMRNYLVKKKYDKTGRGLLLMSFVYILAYFINDYLIK
jgi:hypothetical protein